MNVFLTVGGAMALLGGLAHTVLGHRWTVQAVDPAHAASERISGAANQRFVLWFWHIGSAVLLSTGAAFLLEGLGTVDVADPLLHYMAGLWAAITAIGLIAALRPPSQVREMVPVLVGIPINACIWLGLLL